MNFEELLPFLIPFIIVAVILLVFTLRHIFTHKTYKRGSRMMWVIITIIGFQFIGPILYFTIGKEDN